MTRIPAEHGFQILDLFIDGNGLGDSRDLAALALPGDLDWSQGVVLNGKAPLWLHTWAMDRCRPAPWLAVMDPRQGGIVVRAGEQGPDLASVIPIERIERHLPRREPTGYRAGHGAASEGANEAPIEQELAPAASVIAFVGPPHSGKSVLIHAVYEGLRRVLPAETFQRDVFLLRACPDGEGNWFGEIPPDRAAILRFKNQWDDDFVAGMTAQIGGLASTKGLLLVDCGGRIDGRTRRILDCCNAAVIVSRSAEAAAEWRGALLASGIELLAEIESVPAEAREVTRRAPLRLRLGPLERGTVIIDLPEELLGVVAARCGLRVAR